MTAEENFGQLSTTKKFITFIILMVSDILIVLLSFLLAFFARSEILPQFFLKFKEIELAPFSNFLQYFYMAGVWTIIFAYEKLYTKRFSFWEEVKVLLKSATIASSVIMIIFFISRMQIGFSRTIVVLAWMLSLLLFPLFRYIIKSFLIKTNLWKKKLLILGVQQTSLQVLKNIKTNKTMGYEVIGFLDDDPEKTGKKYLGVPVLGPIAQFEEIANTYKFKDIMIATPHLPRQKLDALLSKCARLSDSMWLIPRSGDFITEGVDIEIIGDVLSLYFKKNLAKPWNIVIKNVYEIILTTISVVIFVPVFLLIGIAISLDSKGPIFYVQDRIGKGKSIFKLFKFRSMYIDNDRRLAEYLKEDPQARSEWDEYKKLKNHDPRVTPVGKFLRRYSLDELPQLFNVLQGKMSLVGPRPYLSEELEGKDTFKSVIALVKPGITGLWQISGRSELPFAKRISLDEYYIRNWSVWLDVTILLKSIKVWLSQKGAY
jgi:undecaprenyl-phosphate galactose phosphotransferase